MLYHLSQLCDLLVLTLQLLLKFCNLASIYKLSYSFLVLFENALPYFLLPHLFDALLFRVFSFKILIVSLKVVFVKIFANLVFHSILIGGIHRLVASERILIVES